MLFTYDSSFPLSPYPTPTFLFSFMRVIDIAQLKLIMMLVGTPGPELLMKSSSESVSLKYHPAPPACVCVALARDRQLLYFVLLPLLCCTCFALKLCGFICT